MCAARHLPTTSDRKFVALLLCITGMGSGTSCYSAASSPIGCSTLYAYRVRFASLIAENMGIWKGR